MVHKKGKLPAKRVEAQRGNKPSAITRTPVASACGHRNWAMAIAAPRFGLHTGPVLVERSCLPQKVIAASEYHDILSHTEEFDIIRLVHALVLFVSLFGPAAILGQKISEPSGVTIGVTNTGVFTIQGSVPAWTYSGSIPGNVSTVTGPVEGSDNNQVSTNGAFDQFTVNYLDPEGNPWQMQLRAYRALPSATISFSPLMEVPNQRPYAVLNRFPVTPHHFANAGWNRAFGLVGWLEPTALGYFSTTNLAHPSCRLLRSLFPNGKRGCLTGAPMVPSLLRLTPAIPCCPPVTCIAT